MLPVAAALGNALDLAHCREICSITWRRGDRGATNDMLVGSLRLQAPWAAAARAAKREDMAAVDDEWGSMTKSTQLARACVRNDERLVRGLVRLGAPLDAVSGHDQLSALQIACMRGFAGVARVLLDGRFEGRGAAPDSRGPRSGWTSLMHASHDGNVAIARLLLSYGARQQVQTHWSRQNAMHLAISGRACASIIELLCSSPGAREALEGRMDNGATPYWCARRYGSRPRTVAIMVAHGAPGGYDRLDHACDEGLEHDEEVEGGIVRHPEK